MMRFSTVELMDEGKCYERLVTVLHPEGLQCPRCQLPVEHSRVHRRDRAPVFYYRCSCGRLYNAFAGTGWEGAHHRCSRLVRLLQGISQGVPTLHLALELGIDRKHLLERRHKLQALAAEACAGGLLLDATVEADERYQHAGEQGVPHLEAADPPRRRAHQGRGHGPWDNDRPPVLGIVGRDSGQVRLDIKKQRS